MKLFIDTANTEEIRKANDLGVICGVTTNPSLIAKEGLVFQDVIKEIKTVIKNLSGKEIIHQDYTEDCVATLNTLMEAKNVSSQSAVIFTAFNDLKKALVTTDTEYFCYDLWSDLKTAGGNLSIERPKHATSQATADKFNDALGDKVSNTRTVVRVSEVEKLDQSINTITKSVVASTDIFFLGIYLYFETTTTNESTQYIITLAKHT